MHMSMNIEHDGGEDFQLQMEDEEILGGGKVAKDQLTNLLAKMVERVSNAYDLNIRVVKKDA